MAWATMSLVSERVDPTSQTLELRHLRGFVAVAEELNFRRAAERLYITQPALTRQIQTLERLVGCDLLIRSTRTVRLTQPARLYWTGRGRCWSRSTQQ